MSEIQQLIGRMPVQRIAQQAGVDETDARRAIEAIVPTLVGGMQANAHDPAGARSLAGALGSHQGRLDARLAGDVDAADGQKIVRNVFGDNTERVAQAAGGGSALGGVIQKILPIVAPIVLSWIANKFFDRGGQQPQSDAQAGQQRGGFRLDDLLGGVLGGGSAEQQGGGALGPLGDVLGGLLGGGRR